MLEYHKIETLFKRDEKTKKLIEGEFRNPTIEYLKDNLWEFTEKIDGCLHYKTRIIMADGGTKQINQINVGDLVIGYDIEKQDYKIVAVEGIQHKSRAGQWVKVKTTRVGLNKGNNYGLIHCTHDHKIWTKNRGYVEASKLTNEDIILNIRTDLSLTPIQEQILVGKMLGDGTFVVKNNEYVNTASIEWGQKEQEYTEWCLRGLQEIAGNEQKYQYSGYGTKIYKARTKTIPVIYDKFKDWFIDEKKQVPNNIKLTPISLAFWYMDDGALNHIAGQEDRVRFATNGFNRKSCENLLKALERLDIYASIKNYKGNTICLDTLNSEKMFLLITPYICECKKYKLPERYRHFTPFLPKSENSQYHKLIVEQKVLSIEIDTKPRERWDIQTETHNFFTTGGLVHNTNIRILWDGHKVTFAGRTDKAQIPAELTNKLVELFGGETNEQMFEQKFGETEVMLVGEGYGAKIQNGGLYRNNQDFILFDVMIAGNWQPRDSVKDIAQYFGIETVPMVLVGTIQEAVDYVKTKPKSKIGTANSEGLVGRPTVELQDRCGNRIIVKVKVRDFEENK